MRKKYKAEIINTTYQFAELEGVEFIYRMRSDSPSIKDLTPRVYFTINESNKKDVKKLLDKLAGTK